MRLFIRLHINVQNKRKLFENKQKIQGAKTVVSLAVE